MSFILLSILCLLVLYLFLARFSVGNTKGPPVSKYSPTIDESKKTGVFQFEVVADKATYTLDSGLKFEIKNAWVENSWSTQVYMIKFGTTPFQRHNWSQLIMNVNIISNGWKRKNPFDYYIGNRHLNPFVYYYCDSADSIRVPLYRETSPHLPHRKGRIAFDTITFVKRK